MSRIAIFATVVLWVTGALAKPGHETRESGFLHQGPIFIKNIRIIDGRGNAPLEGYDIAIVDGKIEQIGRHGSVQARLDAYVISGEGRTVLPGLIDGHSHLTVNPSGATYKPLEIGRVLKANLYAGVTTICDLGSELVIATDLRDAINDGHLLGPTIHTVGDIFEEPSERDDFLNAPALSRMADYINLLDLHQERGVDRIKAYVMIPLIRMQQLATEAHKRDMRLVVDVGAWIGTTAYVRAGIDGWAHVAFTHPLSDEEVEEAKKQGIWAIGTNAIVRQLFRRTNRILTEGVTVLDSPLVANLYGEDELTAMRAPEYTTAIIDGFVEAGHHGYGKAFFENSEETWPENGIANTKRLIEAGTLVGLGTDPLFPGMFHGEAMHYEMEVWTRGQVPNLAVIQSATYNNAVILQIENQVGSIQKNLTADLLIVEGNPADQITDTRNIVAVIKGGKVIDRTALEYR
ncbi:amidohydrolase family protein [Kineobactrum salinum]|uniref:Amidohydrolase family protein n=1 Tax=Kineobactrum salinum TaxID=2708301 RepID=A0A6C0U2K9_9GAMM|nr:amidohydrolase family protein [Kineobactrum salinum]QIB64605.1 amidohydrolase family protein [Kineobactrum salinum]